MNKQTQKALEMARELLVYSEDTVIPRDAFREHRQDVRNCIKAINEALSEQEPVACWVGMKGSAFDMPDTKRAYTYKHQPNNDVAHKLGKAVYETTKKFNPDNIDTGLILLRELHEQGFGVFNIGAEFFTSPLLGNLGLRQTNRLTLTAKH